MPKNLVVERDYEHLRRLQSYSSLIRNGLSARAGRENAIPRCFPLRNILEGLSKRGLHCTIRCVDGVRAFLSEVELLLELLYSVAILNID
jgi:hypothetical protein